jgi:putative copper resistance protein D
MLNRALLEWPLVIATIVIFGTAGFALFSISIDRGDLSAVTTCMLPVWRLLGVITLLASPLVFLNVVAEMATVSWRAALPLMPEVFAETHAGHVWEWFLPIAFLIFLAAFIPIRPFIRVAILFTLAAVLLFFRALLSHAIDKGVGAIIVYFIHEAGAALWIGSLLVLWMVAKRGKAPYGWIEDAARLVSKVAFWSVVAIVISGIYAAYNGLGFSLHQLVFSAYGQTLIAKVMVFAAVLAIGGYNRYWLVPHLDDSAAREGLLRNVGVESVILVFGVLALATLLANTPPAHGSVMNMGHSAMVMFTGEPLRRRTIRRSRSRY